MKHIIFCLLIAFCTIYLAPHAHANNAVGVLNEAHGHISIIRRDSKQPQPLRLNDTVFIGDTILTDKDEHAVIEFIDNTVIHLKGEDGQLEIDQFVYDPKNPAKNNAEFTILRATFEYIGGLVSKGNARSQINLDFGSIGIRGTHLYRTMSDMKCWIFLEEGAIDVFNNSGRVSLAANDGTSLSSKNKNPAPAKPWGAGKILWIKSELIKPRAMKRFK